MKSVLLGLALAAFAASSAFAEGCSYGTAKMSHAKPETNLAQTQSVRKLVFAELKDAWLINFLKRA